LVKRLSQHHILSAPIMEGVSFIGFFDYADAIAYLLTILSNKLLEQLSTIEKGNESIKPIIHYILNQQPVPVRYVTDMSMRDPFYSLLPESSLLQALEILGREDGVRRVAITGGSSGISLLGILSQSDIIRFLASHVREKAS
jgi:CBS domain-containing protein